MTIFLSFMKLHTMAHKNNFLLEPNSMILLLQYVHNNDMNKVWVYFKLNAI